MIAVVIVFLILIFGCTAYLVWRFLWPYFQRKLSPRTAETATDETPDTLPKPQKKQKVKTVRCPECGQRTIKDATLSCQWCGTPLIGKPFKEREEKVKKLKEPKLPKEKPIVVKTPFALSCVGCLVIIVLVILVLGGASYGLLMTEALDDLIGDNDIYLQIKAIVNPPKPEVVSQDVREAAPGGDYMIVGRCAVANYGGSGKIQVTARLDAYGQRFTKSRIVYLRSGQTEDLEFNFPEVTVERRILDAILGYLTGGGWRSVTSPNVDLDIRVTPAR